MRVVRVITRLNRGGPLRQLEALVPGLAREGIEGPVWVGETVRGERDASDDLRRHGVEIERVPGLTRSLDLAHDSRAWRWMRRRLGALRPDVVHTHLGKAGALGRTAARSAGVPAVVHTFHGHHFDAPGRQGRATRVVERALAAESDGVVALSERQRHDLVKRHGVVAARRVVVIGPGLDLDALRARAVEIAGAATALRERLAAKGRPTFLWLGRFVPVKATTTLLDAVRFTSPEAFRLVLAGDGPQARATHAYAARHGLLDRVRFVGEVADPVPWILATDGVVLSSSSEGTPVALLEAMALGRPVVSFAVGGVPDVVDDEATGLLVPPGHAPALGYALARLAGDPSLRARLGAEAARRAPLDFCAARLVASTAALYRRLLA